MRGLRTRLRKYGLRKLVVTNALVLSLGGLGVVATSTSTSPTDLFPIEPAVGADVIEPVEEELHRELAYWLAPDQETDFTLRDAYKERKLGFEVFRAATEEPERREILEEIPYGPAIDSAALEHGVDSLLVAAVVQAESSFRPTAGSHKGAVGLMQLLPSTAGMSAGRLRDPETNLDAGAKYLAHLLERFDDDLELSLAAYNAGPTNVRRYDGVPPFPETENYVEKVLSIYVDHHRAAWQRSGKSSLLAGTTSV